LFADNLTNGGIFVYSDEFLLEHLGENWRGLPKCLPVPRRMDYTALALRPENAKAQIKSSIGDVSMEPF